MTNVLVDDFDLLNETFVERNKIIHEMDVVSKMIAVGCLGPKSKWWGILMNY